MNVSGEPKETAISREIMPADGSNPASAMNGDLGTSPPNGGRSSDGLAAYLSLTGVANSKDYCHLSNAAAPLLHDVFSRNSG